MNRTQVKSSQIAGIGHDPATGTLEVQFRTGSIYQYTPVSHELFTRMRAAESIGKFFGQHIKQLQTTKLEGGQFVPLCEARASAASVNLALSLAKRAGLSVDEIGLDWQYVLSDAGVNVVAVYSKDVEGVLSGLLQSQVSAIIDAIKAGES